MFREDTKTGGDRATSFKKGQDMAAPESVLDRVTAYARETQLLESSLATLEWDQQTYIPERANDYRSDQIALLAKMLHERKTSSEFGDLVQSLSEATAGEDPHSPSATTARMLQKSYERQVRLPTDLVEALARACSKGQQVWVEARKQNSFADFEPMLSEIVQLKKQEAAAVGYEECPYDALLDEYEAGMRVSQLTPILDGLRKELVPLVEAIVATGKQAPVELLQQDFPTAKQEELGKLAAAEIGFNFDRGRLDVTAHPFCTELGPHDCRITTRYDESFFSSAFFGIMHEAGHGIYEQGLPPEQYGLPPGRYVSLGVHESQSRLWENQVGRSKSFWIGMLPKVKGIFAPTLDDVGLDDWYFAINNVKPSLIRVEADEATYNLHIIIRYELEQALIDGSLAVGDLPDAWNEKYHSFLGVTPPDFASGVLQDVHWSAGLFGYFPTYTLGNLYGAQLFQKAEQVLGDFDEPFRNGQFEPLRAWLTENVYRHGQCFTAVELVENATCSPVSHASLMQHLSGKLKPLFGIG